MKDFTVQFRLQDGSVRKVNVKAYGHNSAWSKASQLMEAAKYKVIETLSIQDNSRTCSSVFPVAREEITPAVLWDFDQIA